MVARITVVEVNTNIPESENKGKFASRQGFVYTKKV